MGDIERAKIGKWEKVGYLLSIGVLFPTFLVSGVLEALGFSFWASIGLTLLLIVFAVYLTSRPAAAERRKRLANDLERGVFDCAIRFQNSVPGSLRDLWDVGVAQFDGQELWFQSQLGEFPLPPTGRRRSYGQVRPDGSVEQTGKKPAGWRRGWSVIALQTGSGRMHLAADESVLRLFQDPSETSPAN